MFGRGVPPNRNGVPSYWFWVTPIGNPLCSVMTGVIDQPPSSASPTRLLAGTSCLRRTAACTVGAITSLCGESSRLRPYSSIRVVVRRARNHLVVVLECRVARVVVALAELVVVQPAVGVAEAAAPQAGDALAQLDDGRVILRVRAGRLLHVDVAELRERPQQLAELDRLPGGELSGRRDAEERIRHVRRA